MNIFQIPINFIFFMIISINLLKIMNCSQKIKLLMGIGGNPEKLYEYTRSNVGRQFIDYFCSAQNTFGEEIIDQYGPTVKLFEIRDGMDIAIQKLKQYQNVILSATNIFRRYNSMMFTKEI